MDATFHDIAGIITDGSGPLNGEGLGRLVASGAEGAALSLGPGEEFALAGFASEGAADEGLNGAPASFFLAHGAAAGPFEQWKATNAVSQFGEAGQGAWAAARAFPEMQKFWLARDQFGQQPLYYAEKGPTTAFATDLKWFFDSGFCAPKLNEDSFAELVQLQFLSGGQTAFEGIRRVFPGETLVIERGRVVDRLRRPTVPLSDRTLVDPIVAFDALDQLFKSAVTRALEGTRQVGCVLTGDLASTALAIAIARQAKRRVRAYVPFAKTGEETRGQAAMAFAKSLGFDPVPLPIDADRFFQGLPAIAGAMTDPVGDQVAIAWHVVAEAAREDGATLILSTGGQELFGAYGRYRTAARPLWLGGRGMRGRGHLQGLSRLPGGPTHWRDGLTGVESRLRGGRFTRIQRLQLVDISTWLPNDMILGEHQVVARAGVELRRPFLDAEMAGFAFSLADQLKLRGQTGGVLLRQWIGKTFPSAAGMLDGIRATPPLGPWLAQRADTLGPAVDRVISEAGLLAPGHANAVFAQTAQKKTKRLGMAAWQLLSFALWYQVHLGDAAPDGDIEAVLNKGI